MTNMNRIFQVEKICKLSHVGCIGIHVMPIASWSGSSMTSPVMRNYSESMLHKKHHLRIPIISAKWPPVMKYNRLPGTPIFIKDFGTVFYFNPTHCFIFYC